MFHSTVKDRPGYDRRYAIDGAKIQRELGFSPRIDFYSWYGRNGETVQKE